MIFVDVKGEHIDSLRQSQHWEFRDCSGVTTQDRHSILENRRVSNIIQWHDSLNHSGFGRTDSVTDMLSTLGWESLEDRRKEIGVGLVRILKGDCNIDVRGIVCPAPIRCRRRGLHRMNVEFCNFVGFEVLCRRMQEGKQMLKDFLEFLRQRAQIQEAYGKALLKLAHTSGGREEIGSLLQSWDSFRMQTEVIGMNHVTTAMALYDEATRMQEFLELQRDRRKRAEDNVRRSQTSLKGFFKKALDCKKIFDQKSKEAEAVSNLYDIESSRSTIIAKDLEKLQQKQTKVCHSAEQANLAYKLSLELLETTRRQWEEHTEHAYNLFETLEEERIICLRNSMWVVTNLGSTSCVTEDAAFEVIRTRLELCDPHHDIASFIQNKKSGSQRPPEIDINDTSKKLPEFQHHIMSKINSIIWKPIETPTIFRKNIPTNAPTVPDEPIDNHEYSTIEAFTLRKIPGAPLRVLYSFRGRNDGELSLEADEEVQLVRKESQDWWEVQKQDGTKGYYPANYLEPV